MLYWLCALLFVGKIGVRLRTWRSRIDEHGIGEEQISLLLRLCCCSFDVVTERAAHTAANRPLKLI